MNRLVLFIHIFLVLISCNPATEVQDKRVVRFNINGSITSLDPAFASNQNNIWAVYQLFSGLVQLDDSLHVIPNIASHWVLSKDRKIYTFHLKNNVQFHSDKCFKSKTPRFVTASDFVYTFNRIINASTASPGAWIFHDKLADNGCKALNDSVLQVELKEPFSPFLGQLSMPYCFVVPSEAIEYYGKSFGQHPIGTGPFKMKFWEDKVKLILHKNENYYEYKSGKRLPLIKALSISFLENKQVSFFQFLQGNLDFYNGLESSFKDDLLKKNGELHEKHKPSFRLEVAPFLNTEYLAFFTDSRSVQFPYNSKEFRKAVDLSIDKQGLVSTLRNNIGKAADGGFVPLGLPGYRKREQMALDNKKKKIKDLLLDCGYLNNSVPIQLVTTKDYADIGIYIQQQLKKNGILCEVEVVPASRLKQDKRNGKLAFFRASWIADYPDAENYLSCFVSHYFAPNGPNYTHFSNQLYDSLYEQSLSATSEIEQIQKYEEMDDVLINESPCVVLFYDESIRLVKHGLVNFRNNPLNIPILKYCYWE